MESPNCSIFSNIVIICICVCFPVLAINVVILVKGQSCPVTILDADRRDCYPRPDASQAACEARGCLWCAAATGYPWCFINDKVCPSQTPEASRTDMPEGGGRNACLLKGCLWCETTSPGSCSTWLRQLICWWSFFLKDRLKSSTAQASITYNWLEHHQGFFIKQIQNSNIAIVYSPGK